MIIILHLGDITKLNGADLEPVDVVCGGSPCQDLSVAGLRKGLVDGERSSLFMEQIRIIKEMRERDKRNGIPDEYLRPRYMVFENVPGIYSSGAYKGADFQIALTEIIRIADPNADPVPLPEKGKWEHSGCIYDELGKWSVAYSLHDAKDWGVPQRRKRLCLVADFNGLTAFDIVFKPTVRRDAGRADADQAVGDSGIGGNRQSVLPFSQGLQRNPQSCSEKRKGSAGNSEDCIGEPGEPL